MTSTCDTLSGEEGSFYDRKPSVEFKPPTPDWGYLAQVNEKFRNILTWEVERIVGEPPHRAMFQCTPGIPSLTLSCVGLAANPEPTHVVKTTLTSGKSVSIWPLLSMALGLLIVSDRERDGEARKVQSNGWF